MSVCLSLMGVRISIVTIDSGHRGKLDTRPTDNNERVGRVLFVLTV